MVEYDKDTESSTNEDQEEKNRLLHMRFSEDIEAGGEYKEEEDNDGRGFESDQLQFEPHVASTKSFSQEMGEYFDEMKDDIKANLGYMKDSLFTKQVQTNLGLGAFLLITIRTEREEQRVYMRRRERYLFAVNKS